MQSTRIIRPAAGTALILLIPLVMTILDRGKVVGAGWHWSPMDFVVMGGLLFGAGLTYELLSGRLPGKARSVALALAIVLIVLAIWVELAVDGVSQLFSLLAS